MKHGLNTFFNQKSLLIEFLDDNDELILLKRVIYAQVVKMMNSGKCPQDKIDEIAIFLQNFKLRSENSAITIDILDDEI